MREFAPIHTPSLPVPGTRFQNKHGIEWVVDGHLRASSFATQSGDDSAPSEYPVIFPASLSSKTTALLDEVSRCTPKLILPLSTMPTVFPSRAHPGGHTIDAWSHPDHIHIFLDADDVSEVVFAHELAHAWIDLVRGIEDNRVWRDRSDSARYAQVQFIQSFVLDFAVDQVLHEKGFDRSQIIEDLQVASDQLRTATENGYQPKNRREAVFMATHLASILVEDTYDRMPVRQADLFPVVGRNLPEVFTLARSMAQCVLDFFPSNRSTAKTAIDQSLNIAFDYTDPNLDIENHLIHVEPEINWGIDKFPDWLTGQSVRAKCEIGVAMAAAGATSADIPVLHRENEGPVTVTFHRPDGSVTAPIPLVHAVLPPDQRVARVNELMEDRRRAIANIERRNGTNPNPVKSPQRPNVPAQGWQVPSPSPHLPNVPGSQLRSYSPGLARWLTQVRVEEMLAGEHPYGYAENDPVKKSDPSGLRPCKLFEALDCYSYCADAGARYTGTCTASDFWLPIGPILVPIVRVDCNCQPLLPDCRCDPRRLGRLMLQIALTCSVPRKCGPYLAAPPNKNRCPAIIANITRSLGCIYAQDALNKECFDGGNPGHKDKIQQAWNAINTCSRALVYNGCGPYPR